MKYSIKTKVTGGTKHCGPSVRHFLATTVLASVVELLMKVLEFNSRPNVLDGLPSDEVLAVKVVLKHPDARNQKSFRVPSKTSSTTRLLLLCFTILKLGAIGISS